MDGPDLSKRRCLFDRVQCVNVNLNYFYIVLILLVLGQRTDCFHLLKNLNIRHPLLNERRPLRKRVVGLSFMLGLSFEDGKVPDILQSQYHFSQKDYRLFVVIKVAW